MQKTKQKTHVLGALLWVTVSHQKAPKIFIPETVAKFVISTATFFFKEVKRHLEFLAKISQRSDSSWVFFLLPTSTLNIKREKKGGLTATLAFFFGGLLVLGSELFLFFSGDFFFFSISFLSLGFSSCSDPEPLSEEDGSLSNLPTNNKLRPKNSCISLLHPPWLARVGNDFLDLPHLTEQCSTWSCVAMDSGNKMTTSPWIPRMTRSSNDDFLSGPGEKGNLMMTGCWYANDLHLSYTPYSKMAANKLFFCLHVS